MNKYTILKFCTSFIGFSILPISVAAGILTFEFEVSEFKSGGEPWDSKYLLGDPQPDVEGVIKRINGEACEIPLHKDTHALSQTCSFLSTVVNGEVFSIQLSDKDVARADDLIFSGSVTFSENPTIIENPPNSFLKKIKISKMPGIQ